MAQDEDIRIVDLPTTTELPTGSFVAVDSTTTGTNKFDLSTLKSAYILKYSEVGSLADIDLEKAKAMPTFMLIDDGDHTIVTDTSNNSNGEQVVVAQGTLLCLEELVDYCASFTVQHIKCFPANNIATGAYGNYNVWLSVFTASALSSASKKTWAVFSEFGYSNLFSGTPMPLTKQYMNGRGPGSLGSQSTKDQNALAIEFQANGKFRRQLLMPMDLQNHSFDDDQNVGTLQFMAWDKTSNRAGYTEKLPDTSSIVVLDRTNAGWTNKIQDILDAGKIPAVIYSTTDITGMKHTYLLTYHSTASNEYKFIGPGLRTNPYRIEYLMCTWTSASSVMPYSYAEISPSTTPIITLSSADNFSGRIYVDNNAVTVVTDSAVLSSSTLTIQVGAGNYQACKAVIEITPTANMTVTVVNYAQTTLKHSTAGGNQLTAGKTYQVSVMGNCWTCAEFEA